MSEGFDYGSEHEVEDGGIDFKNPTVGDHSARLRDIIHVGMYSETYKGKAKKPAPYVVAVFELKEDDDFEDDGETPLTINRAFPLRKGDRAFMTTFRKALDPNETATGFDDMIGLPCTINCKGGKETNDDGTPKYVNFGGISGVPAKFVPLIDDLKEGFGVGHVRFKDITEDAILALHPIIEVHKILMQSSDYRGSAAEKVIAEIRKENPDFARPSAEDKKDGDKNNKTNKAQDPETQPEVETDLDEQEEF